METKLSKAEMLLGLKARRLTELELQVDREAEAMAQTRIKPEFERAKSLDEIAIARAELTRRRRRLGTLTREQEVAIEELLMCTAVRISELVGRAMRVNTLGH